MPRPGHRLTERAPPAAPHTDYGDSQSAKYWRNARILRCLSDQPVAEIVQCGEPASKALPIDKLQNQPNRCIELPQPK